MAFNGKILTYSRDDPIDKRRKFINEIPRRTNFIDLQSRKDIVKDISNEKEIMFLPNDLLETQSSENGKRVQKLILFGILKNGSKACVVLGDIDLFFDIEVPEGIDPQRFVRCLYPDFNKAGCYPIASRTQIVELLPFKYYHESKKKYVRLFFNTLFQRKKGIQFIIDYIFEYANDNGDLMEMKLSTASDDLSCSWRKYSRESGVKLCDWCVIEKYERDTSQTYAKNISVEFTFLVKAQNFRAATSEEANDKCYKLDKSSVLTWDLETFAIQSDGNAPDAEKVFTEDGRPSDTIEMDSMTFHWYYDRNPLVKICLSVIPCPPVSDCLIIQCGDQLDLLHCKAMILESMAPEFVIGFNDGIYDWNFVINRLLGYDKQQSLNVYESFKRRASCLMANDDRLKYDIKGRDIKANIKIAADIAVDNTFFKVPGYINIDVRTVFRKLYPTAEKSSLAFFLEKNKLGGKEDMPYLRMFKIFKLMREFSAEVGKDYKKIIERVDSLISEHGGDWKYFEHNKKRAPLGDLDKMETAESSYYIERLTLTEIRELIKESEKVVIYCNVDAQRCQDLLKVRNVIADFREMANISYTSMADAVDRAGGMKVRNLVMARGKHLAFSTITNKKTKDPRKYPGALVIPPVKNLSRDHVVVKRLRRKLRERKKANEPYNISYKTVDPRSPDFDASLLNEVEHIGQADLNQQNQQNTPRRDPIDEGKKSDRPNAGLDASSLYPSLVMVYNLSPEKAVVDNALHDKLVAQGVRMEYVEFLYGLPDDSDENKEVIKGWFVQHIPHKDATGKYTYENMGIYPTLLKELFDSRSELKALMEIYAKPKEALDKIFENRELLQTLASKPITEQKEFLRGELQKLIDFAKKELDKNGGKKYYKYKYHDALETMEFFSAAQDGAARDGIEGSGWFVNQSESVGINDVYNEIEFQFAYYNNKQLSRKVFMNTFYGETGNNISPFFMIHVAGGITSKGQENLKRVKTHIEGMEYVVKYGDTDSLYTECPEKLFIDVDRLYETGKISKLEYWTAMIEITMEDLDKLKNIVNKFLEDHNGTNLLKFAYEEVLFPYAFVGKKKYIGIPHMGIVRLACCMPDCPLSTIMKPGTLFIRGLELKKRGGSDFMKINCYEVWKDAFCIENTETLREIVERHMKEIVSKPWSDSMFVRSKRYKLPTAGKPGNVSVLKFIERMRYVEKNYPDLGIKVPEVGERFNVIYAKKYPWQYGITGSNKRATSIGDQMEFFESLGNQKYKEYLESRGVPLEINIDYYMEGEICGQYARFLMYHPDYDDLFEEWMYQDDDAYKAADKKAHMHVKKVLVDYYKTNFGDVYPEANNIYKQFRETLLREGDEEPKTASQTKLAKKLENRFINTNNIIKDEEGNIILDVRKDVPSKMAEGLIKDAKKLGETRVDDLISVIKNIMKVPEIMIRPKFAVAAGYGKSSVFDNIERSIKEDLIRDLQNMRELMKEYKELFEADLTEEGRIMEIIKQHNNLDKILSRPIVLPGSDRADRSRLFEISKTLQEGIIGTLNFACIDEIKREQANTSERKTYIVDLIHELFYDLASKYKRIAEINNAREYLKNKFSYRAPSAQINMASEASEFASWVSSLH